jgi:tRNA(fMet)-specific endonuclease VapC
VRIALDTNRYADLVKGDKAVAEIVGSADEVIVPLIVLAELRAGFAAGTQQARNEAVLRRFLAQPGVSVLCPDEQTSFHYAGVFTELRRRGTPVPTNDLWIAALVLQHGLVLHARDRHFDFLPQIPRV